MSVLAASAVFLTSCLALAFTGRWLVSALARIADFLRWKEFTVAFFLMSAATAMPEFFVGIGAAVRGVPELSFGNIIGQSIIHFTVAVFAVTAVTGGFKVRSRLIRASAWFSGIMALLPVILIADGLLSRTDGVVLILAFLCYSLWLFSKRDNFGQTYEAEPPVHQSIWTRAKIIFKDFSLFFIGAIIIILAAQGIVASTLVFAGFLGLPLVVVGAIVVALGTAMPEVYFSMISAKQNHGEMMLGNLLGSTAVSVSMVLGVVALISPIVVPDLSPYLLGRAFLMMAVASFILFIYTDKKLTVKEAAILLGIYFFFLASEIFVALA